jgi:hypothetical protein
MVDLPTTSGGELIAGRYVIEQQVHEGGMARVYRAQDIESQQTVALKRPARQDPGTLARFLEEAKILGELNHPAVVRQLAHGGSTFADAHMVMEWLSGETLEQRLAAGRLGGLSGGPPCEADASRPEADESDPVRRLASPHEADRLRNRAARDSARPERSFELCRRHLGLYVTRASHGQR